MKKLLVVLLSLGLIVGLGSSASAATAGGNVSWAGTYETFGIYDDNSNLAGDTQSATAIFNQARYSRAALWQRVRLMPTWNIAEGLSFTARMDALEKDWGSAAWKSTTNFTTLDETSSRKANVPATGVKTQENIEFERGYVTFTTRIGQFMIGYQEAAVWGTKWADYNITRPRLRYQLPVGPVTILAIWEKGIEWDNFGNSSGPNGKVDADTDTYYLAGIYKQGQIEAGLLYGYVSANTTRLVAAAPFKAKIHTLQPYAKVTLGPVYFEAEIDYQFGKAAEYDNLTPAQLAAGVQDIKKQGWAAYALARATFGPAYFGLGFGYLSGDNDQGCLVAGGACKDTDKTSGVNGKDWNPALIMGNNDSPDPIPANAHSDDPGGIGMGYGSKKEGTSMYNLFAGYNATPKLKFDLSLSLAKTNVKFKPGMFLGSVTGKSTPGAASNVEYLSDDIGKEVDITATYKIFDNLTYMVGAGYMWVGDFFKGTDPAKTVGNDYQLLHKLTMAF